MSHAYREGITRGNTAISDVNRSCQRINNQVSSCSAYWVGVAKNEFVSECYDMTKSSGHLNQQISEAISAINSVEYAIDRAETQRRIEKEKMLEKLNSSNLNPYSSLGYYR